MFPRWCWKLNFGPLKEHSVLLITESSLQPQFKNTICMSTNTRSVLRRHGIVPLRMEIDFFLTDALKFSDYVVFFSQLIKEWLHSRQEALNIWQWGTRLHILKIPKHFQCANHTGNKALSPKSTLLMFEKKLNLMKFPLLISLMKYNFHTINFTQHKAPLLLTDLLPEWLFSVKQIELISLFIN